MIRTIFLLLTVLIVLIQIPNARSQTADHNAANLALVPDAALVPASNLRMHLRRASVGGNISDGLDVLRSANAKYDRSKWIFADRGNNGWAAKISDFVSFTDANQSNYDVLSMKFCFIDPDAKYFRYRDSMLYLENRYPAKKFIWWTIPIETSGNTDRQAFNDSVRAFAVANGKILFDIADIEACNIAGVKQVDGSNRETMRSEWTSDGGHLSTAGAQRVASAFWWLMARIAGWNDSSGLNPQ
jgi:hypothetical protein